VGDREAGERQQRRGGVAQHRLDLGELAAEHPGDGLELLVDVLVVGLGEDRADGCGDHLGRALGDLAEHVAQEVHPASLDRRAGQDRPDGLAQAQVGVGDDQLHPTQPAGPQAPQERGPKGAVLAVTHAEPKDLPAAVTADAGGDHDGLVDHPPVDAGFAVGGV
jgi:hypothetical protein